VSDVEAARLIGRLLNKVAAASPPKTGGGPLEQELHVGALSRRRGLNLQQAAAVAGKSQRTLRNWCIEHGIGRRVADGTWVVSRVALAMLLDGDLDALASYRDFGVRASFEPVRKYYERFDLGECGPRPTPRGRGGTSPLTEVHRLRTRQAVDAAGAPAYDPLLTKTPEPTRRKKAASSECLRTGARLVPAITASIQAAASFARVSCAIAP
jgi:hypothetical protein